MIAALRRTSGELIAGIGIIALIVVIAVLVGVLGLGPDPYRSGDDVLAGPGSGHPLGTDNLGRDSFARLALASGTTVGISAVATLLALIAGVALGLLAGYGPRLADSLIMRSSEVVLAIPAILVALIARVVFGPGVLPLVLSMAVVYTPVFARVMRAPTLSLRERDFVLAAEIAGARRWTIALRHILPNAITPVLVQAAATASEIVLLEAALSYLGQGVQPPDPSAGRMISEFQKYLQTDPLLIVLPAALIVLISTGWNLIADGLRAVSNRSRTVDIPRRSRVIVLPGSGRAEALRAIRADRSGRSSA